MPRVAFDKLPADARLWVFGASRPLDASEPDSLLAAVDGFLDQWKAHGMPLTCGRDWRDARFLAIAVDQRDAHASGCSIDGLYRVLRDTERALKVALLGGGVVFFRTADGRIESIAREEFALASERGDVTRDTVVFDLTVATVGEWRDTFEKPARESWHERLLDTARA
jgi:hypothetical protein